MAGALAEQALEEHMRCSGFVEIEMLEQSKLEIERLRYYPLFTVEFLNWMETVMEREGSPPIYRVHIRGRKPQVD
ncbi:MAG TPA: hypothetical protein VFZ12_04380 [Dehalococcoidia bacterium]|nr:hypothetical protein [Dehalococcoidia bacterium]